jgi:sugar phosphate isomerase/epimerase
MKFAICNELYVDWPFEAAFSHAAQLGYQGIEIAPFTMAEHVDGISDEQCKSVRKIADANELEIVGLHWLLAKTTGLHLTTDKELARKKTAEYLTKLIRVCGKLGGQIMVFGSPQQRNLEPGTTLEQGHERARNIIQSLVPELESNQVTLALEPLGPEEGNFFLTAEETVGLIERIGSEYVQLHLDVKAMSTEAKPIPQIIRDSQQHLVHFHANDPNRRGPGMGQVDFGPIMKTLRDINYADWISVEVFDYSPGIDALASESIACLNKFSQS